MRSKQQFTVVYRDHYAAIHRYIKRQVRDADLSEDLAGEVFYRAWRSRSQLQVGTSPRAWLFTIARNLVVDHWRKRKELPLEHIESIPDPASASMAEAFERADTHWELMRALDRLPGQLASVIILRFIEGLPAKQVAILLETTEGNVRVMQYRALRQLRRILDHDQRSHNRKEVN